MTKVTEISLVGRPPNSFRPPCTWFHLTGRFPELIAIECKVRESHPPSTFLPFWRAWADVERRLAKVFAGSLRPRVGSRAIVVESSWSALEIGKWRSQITPSQAVGSCLGWIAMGIPIVMAGSHERAGRYIGRLLYTSARRRWREARYLLSGVLSRQGAG